MRFRELDAAKIVSTIETLERRVSERFPESGLRVLCQELLGIAREASERAASMARPNWPLRAVVGVIIAAILVIVVAALGSLRLTGFADFSAFAQAMDAGINDVIFLGIAIFFLVSLERRIKRRRALGALHELRSLAHIVDMHQLTKDPEQLTGSGPSTPSSPERTMTRFELGRYLDYCTELSRS